MRKFLLAALALCLWAATASAQSSTGRLVGAVSTADGVVAGAAVTAKDNQTGRERTATSSDEGSFVLPQLEVGVYTVTITAPGFKTFTAEAVKIDVGREYTLAATLSVGNVSEQVTVVAGADVMNTSNAQLSNTVSPQQILELPLNGRNPITLLTLQAGTASNGAVNTSVNGGRPAFTNITRDGISVQDNYIRANASDFAVDRPTSDDVGEFTVTTQNAGADRGYGSSHIELVTPRGASGFHGALYAYNRNSKFSGNSFFNNAAGNFGPNDMAVLAGAARVGDPKAPRPFLNRNNFGGKLSGPLPLPNFGEGGPAILRGKAFFFGAYEGLRTAQSLNVTNTILLPSARAGNFTYRDSAGTLRTVNIFSLGSGVTGINPLIQSRVLDRMPAAGNITTVGDQLNTTGFLFSQSNVRDADRYTMRFDVEPTDRHSFSLVYKDSLDTNLRADTQNSVTAATFGSGGFGATPSIIQLSDNRFMAAAWRWTPRPNFTNEVRGGFLFSEVPFNRSTPEPEFFLNIPSAFVTNPETNFQSQGRTTNTYNLQDNAEYIRGDHSFRFGGQAQFIRIRSFGPSSFQQSTVPTLNIGTSSSSPQLRAEQFAGGINPAQLTTANQLLALLGGIVGGGNLTFNARDPQSGFLPDQEFAQLFNLENYSLYFADQWRLTPRFVLNLGLRYEPFTSVREPNSFALEPVIGEQDPVAALLDPNGAVDFIGRNAGERRFFKSDLNNFAPVLSFAWSPQFKNNFLGSVFPGEGRTVLRGGYRMSFVNDEYIRVAESANSSNSGLQSTRTLANLNARVDAPPAFAAPAFQVPRSFAAGNAIASNFGTVFAVDPNLRTGNTHEFNVGIQRELAFQTVLEVRYVHSRSDNLFRGLDINEIDIFDNGFLNDFNRARQNLFLANAERARLAALNGGVVPANAPASTGLFQPAFAGLGLQPLTFFGAPAGAGQTAPAFVIGTGGLSAATFNNNLNAGTPADLALTLIQNGLRGNFRFRPNENAGAVDLIGNSGVYRYNALQMELRRRFSQGLYFQANYTFQKTLTNASGLGQNKFDPNLTNRLPELEIARADFDSTHVFNFNGIYHLPFGQGKRFLNGGGLLDRLAGGWQVTSIVQINTGAPITIVDPRGTFNRAGRALRQTPQTALTKGEIKDLVGIFRTPCGVYWINPSVLNINQDALAAGQCGSLGSGRGSEGVGFGVSPFPGQVFFNNLPGQTGGLERGFINGPLYLNWDASIIKNISITETTRLQLRAEAFNVLNRANFFVGNVPGSASINSANFGKVSSTFTSSGNQRVLQFAMRFEF